MRQTAPTRMLPHMDLKNVLGKGFYEQLEGSNRMLSDKARDERGDQSLRRLPLGAIVKEGR